MLPEVTSHLIPTQGREGAEIFWLTSLNLLNSFLDCFCLINGPARLWKVNNQLLLAVWLLACAMWRWPYLFLVNSKTTWLIGHRTLSLKVTYIEFSTYLTSKTLGRIRCCISKHEITNIEFPFNITSKNFGRMFRCWVHRILESKFDLALLKTYLTSKT